MERKINVTLNQIDNELGAADPDSAGQSGDTQGLSSVVGASEESVEDLAEAGQAYEAEVIEGVESAADHPEQPLRPRYPTDR